MLAPSGLGNDTGQAAYFQFFELWRWCWSPGKAIPSIDARPLSKRTGTGDVLPYLYSATAYSDPLFWDGRTRRTDDMLRAQRIDEVRYPSDKALFLEPLEGTVFAWALRAEALKLEAIGLAAGDASASFHRISDLAQPDPRGERGGSWQALPATAFGVHTTAGVHGRDVVRR
ncbi:MAG: hypothetical protein ACTS22_08135 [Phycisphaerales bacterium]